MRQRVFWAGAILALVLVVVQGAGERAPVSATVPGAALRAHAFAHGVPANRQTLSNRGTMYLSLVSGGSATGSPAVAAVREAGRLRLVKAGDTLDGAVVAGIEAGALTLKAADRTIVMTKVAR